MEGKPRRVPFVPVIQCAFKIRLRLLSELRAV